MDFVRVSVEDYFLRNVDVFVALSEAKLAVFRDPEGSELAVFV